MRKTISVLAVGSVLVTGVFQVFAQSPSAEWKAKHGVGERYEGIGFDRNVTTVGLELISFLAVSNPDTRAAIDVARDDEIVVDFVSRTASPYQLTARELELSEYYWMEPKVSRNAAQGANTFSGIWKTDLLRELKTKQIPVTVNDLGVLVWFGKGDDDVAQVAPAVMRAASASPPQLTGRYRATFLPDVTFDRVSFSVRAGCQVSDTAKIFPGSAAVGKKYPATSFAVPFSVPAGYSGPVMLEITTTRFVTPKPSQTGGEKDASPAPKTEKIDKSRYCFMHSPQSH